MVAPPPTTFDDPQEKKMTPQKKQERVDSKKKDVNRTILELAQHRLDRYGVGDLIVDETLVAAIYPTTQIQRGHMLGHGQCHAVYDIDAFVKDDDNNASSSSASPYSSLPSGLRRHPERYVLKTLRPSMQPSQHTKNPTVVASAAADLIKEGLLLQVLSQKQQHLNIIALRGWTPGRLKAFLGEDGVTFHPENFGLVIDRLDTTLKDIVAGEWHEEQRWFREKLGDEREMEEEDDDNDDDNDEDNAGGEATLSESPPKSSSWSPFQWWRSLAKRSPEAQKALMDKRHNFFLKRLRSCVELADALHHMHAHRIIHRDLKPGNVGFKTYGGVGHHGGIQQRLIVFDMDISRVIPKTPIDGNGKNDDDDPNVNVYDMAHAVGSPRYMAPEVVRNEPYNLKADVYSFALLVWEMISIERPFVEYEQREHNAMTGVEVDRAILQVGLRPTMPPHIHQLWYPSLVNLIKASWADQHADRPTMAEAFRQIQAIRDELTPPPSSI